MSSLVLKEAGVLSAHKDAVTALEVPEEGNSSTLFSSSRDKKIFQWTVERHEDNMGVVTKEFLKNGHFVNDLVSSKTGDKIVSAGSDKTARIYDINTKAMVVLNGHDRDVTSVTINQADNKILSGSMDGNVCLWNTDGVLVEKYGRSSGGHSDWVTCVAFIPFKDDLAVSGSADGSVKVWDMNKGEVLKTFINGRPVEEGVSSGQSAGVTALSITPDGVHCAYGGRDSEVFILNLDKGACARSFQTESPITALAFALNEPILACSTKTALYLWDVVNDKLLYKTEYARSECGISLVWMRSNLIVGMNNGNIVVYECVHQQ